jgi:muramoyltetrapeptide carboxypeptidase
MEPRPITIYQDEAEITAKVVLRGAARGILIGGSLCMIARAIGWACPNLADAILFLEAVDTPIGAIDATLTQLRRAGYTNGLKGVAVGQFICSAERKPGIWTVIDVLYDHFSAWGVPVLGGLPVGHGPNPPTIPLGTMATLDTAARTLTIEPGIC